MAGQYAPVPQGLSRRVLLLDLDPATLISLEQRLEDAGFDTATTWSIHEAHLLLEKRRFDLMVVGDHRPEIDACAVLRRLESLQTLIPCIVMRARPDFSFDPKWNPLVTVLPGCNSSEVLEQVHQHLSQSISRSQAAPPSKSPSPTRTIHQSQPAVDEIWVKSDAGKMC